MAIPFLQPEDDEAARLHGSGAGAGHPGSAPIGMMASGAGAGSSGIGVGAGPPTNPIPISFGPLPPPPPIMPGGIAGSPAPSGTGTAVQTPLIGPMNGDQLVHLFYEALYRYSRGVPPFDLCCCRCCSLTISDSDAHQRLWNSKMSNYPMHSDAVSARLHRRCVQILIIVIAIINTIITFTIIIIITFVINCIASV
ncbi:uncharacterized protein LOC129753801 [Uranotaenia lowii]|uniref:uncharacterized protein LOC129753801 n=1 Tax=Uranotaenia lowii TaxID=190385 RepID=UPI00247A38E9|nr:uncharacterized protein LOC129753801 [Uranotaenia lowii]